LVHLFWSVGEDDYLVSSTRAAIQELSESEWNTDAPMCGSAPLYLGAMNGNAILGKSQGKWHRSIVRRRPMMLLLPLDREDARWRLMLCGTIKDHRCPDLMACPED
jgi:hypothetical protein